MEKIDALKIILENMKVLTWSVENLVKAESGEINMEISLEDVRKVLSQKSREGFTNEVKNLVNSYNCEKLSQIDKKFYKEIIEKAQVFSDVR